MGFYGPVCLGGIKHIHMYWKCPQGNLTKTEGMGRPAWEEGSKGGSGSSRRRGLPFQMALSESLLVRGSNISKAGKVEVMVRWGPGLFPHCTHLVLTNTVFGSCFPFTAGKRPRASSHWLRQHGS